MGSRCLDLVSSRHRELWFEVELGVSQLASAGGRIVEHLICWVNRQILLRIHLTQRCTTKPPSKGFFVTPAWMHDSDKDILQRQEQVMKRQWARDS